MKKKKVVTRKAAKRRPPSAEELGAALRRRSGFKYDQLVGLAMDGDSEALKQCAALAAVYVDRLPVGAEHRDLKDWLHWALLDLQAGKSPNDAFGRGKRPANRPPDFMAAVRQRAVVVSVETRIAEQPNRDRGEIFEEVGTVYELTEETVATWFNNRT
jgi:hypothetical protein